MTGTSTSPTSPNTPLKHPKIEAEVEKKEKKVKKSKTHTKTKGENTFNPHLYP